MMENGTEEHEAASKRKKHEDGLIDQDKEEETRLSQQRRKLLRESVGITSFVPLSGKRTRKAASPLTYSYPEPSAPPPDPEPSAPEMLDDLDLPIPPGTPPPSYKEACRPPGPLNAVKIGKRAQRAF
jgi:hypothetical protein